MLTNMVIFVTFGLFSAQLLPVAVRGSKTRVLKLPTVNRDEQLSEFPGFFKWYYFFYAQN